MNHTNPSRSIVVVGGGLAGVLFVVHLLRRTRVPLDITILEPRIRLGAGVAYSGAEPSHVTNVPAASMSVDPDDPAAFARWIGRHGDGFKGDERDAYPRRWLFGEYVGELLRGALADRPDILLLHVQQQARDVARTADGFVVQTDSRGFAADAVVLATGNPAPQLPDVLKSVSDSAQCIADPWAPKVLADVPSHARVLIIGTGLTMGDTVAVLRASGHTGEIVAISRRGQMSRRGLASAIEPFGDFRQPPSTRAGPATSISHRGTARRRRRLILVRRLGCGPAGGMVALGGAPRSRTLPFRPPPSSPLRGSSAHHGGTALRHDRRGSA